jgi:methyl-accepting chemotaxis protein PixJ
MTNSKPALDASASHQTARGVSTSVNQGLKSKLIANIRVAIVASAAASTALFSASTYNVWQLYQGFQSTVGTEIKLLKLSEKIVYLDEVLTMSARMSASTGDPQWEKRYREQEPALTNAIEQVSTLLPEVSKANTAQTDAANNKLIAMEEKAFELVKQGKKEQAFALLLSPEYNANKEVYAQGIETTLAQLDQAMADLQKSYSQRLGQSLQFAGISLPLLILSWGIVIWLIRIYMNDRQQAEAALRDSQGSLQLVNDDLAQKMVEVAEKSQQIVAQEQITKEESYLLQSDIGHLLNIVSAVEEGDLTVEAEVSDRATGLVADTFNRLIEQLGITLRQVLNGSEAVSVSAIRVEDLAHQVAHGADQQAQGVNNVLTLSQQVKAAAQQSVVQVAENQASLQAVYAVVEQGKKAIARMNEGVNVLQLGSDRMVQRVKALGEFVGLADEFVQEQNQIASLTQVLALNAALVAAKAAEQRDPRQFQLVAREFETIASQVGNLAQQTNDGLESLQKRTTQIHSVVSEIDAEVQTLGGLVDGFGDGVSASTYAFSNVEVMTQAVVQTSESVATANQDIVISAQSTSQAMQQIAELAVQTAHLTQSTLDQSAAMKTLAQKLLASIQIFRLPEVSTPGEIGEPERIDLSNEPGMTVEPINTVAAV